MTDPTTASILKAFADQIDELEADMSTVVMHMVEADVLDAEQVSAIESEIGKLDEAADGIRRIAR